MVEETELLLLLLLLPLLLLAAGVALSFAFGWNNSSFLVGNGVGSGSLTMREVLLTSSAGMLIGVAFVGQGMVAGVPGQITPAASEAVALDSLVVSLVFTVVLTIARLPVALSTSVVGAFAGAAYRSSLPLNHVRLGEIIGFWIVAPLAAGVCAYALYRVIVRILAGRSLLEVDLISRYGVIATSVLIASVLAENNIGLIYGTMLDGGADTAVASFSYPALLGLTSVAIAGMVLLGRGVSSTVGDRLMALSPVGVISAFLGSALLIWFGTQFGIPISIGQCLMGGMFGSAFTKQVAVLNGRLVLESVALWVLAPVGAFAVAFIILLL